MKQHVSFVGALHVAFGFLENEPIAEKVLSLLGNTISLIIVFFSSLGVIGGIGLFSYKPWARILVMIVSAINCLNIPIGTAKGIYSIWVLMQKETLDLFEPSTQ